MKWRACSGGRGTVRAPGAQTRQVQAKGAQTRDSSLRGHGQDDVSSAGYLVMPFFFLWFGEEAEIAIYMMMRNEPKTRKHEQRKARDRWMDAME